MMIAMMMMMMMMITTMTMIMTKSVMATVMTDVDDVEYVVFYYLICSTQHARLFLLFFTLP